MPRPDPVAEPQAAAAAAPDAAVKVDVLAGLRRCARDVLPVSAPVLLAVSGGSDSMALLDAARAALHVPLHVVHVQHGLRAAAAHDARFVAAVCAERELPFTLCDAPPTEGNPGRGETAARARRLEALQRAALAAGARHVLLAHHRDDALETLLLHLLRGHRGDRALAGIPALRPLGAGVALVHPFLAASPAPGRADLAAYRAAQPTGRGPGHVEDETNRDLAVPRNRVRAWLAADGADLARALLALQRRARARLAARVARVAATLIDCLAPDGLGARLAPDALRAAPDEPPGEHLAELLRLLGPCFAAPRRLDPRAAVVDALARRALAGRGELLLPATPHPLPVRATRAGLCFPDEPLLPGPPQARVLAALAQLPLHLA